MGSQEPNRSYMHRATRRNRRGEIVMRRLPAYLGKILEALLMTAFILFLMGAESLTDKLFLWMGM